MFVLLKKAAIEALHQFVKSKMLNEKIDIVASSTSLDNCLNHMNDRIDELAFEFIELHEFLKIIPDDVLESLKSEIQPIYEECYVTFSFKNVFFHVKRTTRFEFIKADLSQP